MSKKKEFIINIQTHDGGIADVPTITTAPIQSEQPVIIPENTITKDLPSPVAITGETNIEDLVKKYVSTYSEQFKIKEQAYTAKIEELTTALNTTVATNVATRQQQQQNTIASLNADTEARQALLTRIDELEKKDRDNQNQSYIMSMITAEPDLAPMVKKLNIKTVEQFKTIILPMKDELKRLAELETRNRNGNNNIFGDNGYNNVIDPKDKTEMELQALEAKYLAQYGIKK